MTWPSPPTCLPPCLPPGNDHLTTTWGSLYFYVSSTSRCPLRGPIWHVSISPSTTLAVQFVGGMRFDARLIHTSVITHLRGGPSLQTPQLCDHPDQWVTFLPGEQGFCTSILNPAVFGTTQTSTISLVTYPPHAVTSLSLMNLGPVARLDCGEGKPHAHASCHRNKAFRFRSWLHHGSMR